MFDVLAMRGLLQFDQEMEWYRKIAINSSFCCGKVTSLFLLLFGLLEISHNVKERTKYGPPDADP